MLPYTKAVPKELLPIVSTPTGQLVVAEAARVGCSEVLLVLAEGKHAVMDHFRPDPELEAVLRRKGDTAGLAAVQTATGLAAVQEVRQGNPRGLGDAVAHAEQFSAGEPVAVLLPDDLIDDRDQLLGPMIELQARTGGVVLALIEVPADQTHRYGCVATDGPAAGGVVKVVDLVEKPAPELAPSNLAVVGRYVLPPEIFPALHKTGPGAGGEIQLTDAVKRLLDEGVPVDGMVFTGRRYDTGAKLDYLTSLVQLAVREPDVGEAFASWLVQFVAQEGTT